jgi:group II intron reverse transcriptase/maturase
MQPTAEVLERISHNSLSNKDEAFSRLYRYLLRPDIWYSAYKNLYANSGAATRGVNNDTADGFSQEKIDKIIESLADETYQPSPCRRTYIKKANGKTRPLGIPTFTDKLVQESLRMVLEAVYEPIFLDCSHGFRPKRSRHTALKELKNEFTGARWFVEGDIKGCFDNIDHACLIGLIREKIKDARLIKLIYKFLKAGYLENWQYRNTYSGTPQGGIISPILANIYLHELDKFMSALKGEFDFPKKPQKNIQTEAYFTLNSKLRTIEKRLKTANGTHKSELLLERKTIRDEMLRTPAKAQTDKKVKYIRYADDFLIAVNGDRDDCVEIKRKLTEFVRDSLNMELSEEKTLITHTSEKARFLGYDISVRRNSDLKVRRIGNKKFTQRTLSGKVELSVPFGDKINKFLFGKGAVEQKADGTMFPIHRAYLTDCTDLEIINVYNAEVRGICNYYNLACDYNNLKYFVYLMEYSCIKTLANKHKSSIGKVKTMFKDGNGTWGIPYKTKTGDKRCYFVKTADCKNKAFTTDTITKSSVVATMSINTFENRLKAGKCELCGTVGADNYEVHHIHKLKDLSGKKMWERAMLAKRRKTIVLCHDCHKSIHGKREKN